MFIKMLLKQFSCVINWIHISRHSTRMFNAGRQHF